jgi:hypothetical protein
MYALVVLVRNIVYDLIVFICRPGGELMPGEDEVDGLRRSMTEVI